MNIVLFAAPFFPPTTNTRKFIARTRGSDIFSNIIWLIENLCIDLWILLFAPLYRMKTITVFVSILQHMLQSQSKPVAHFNFHIPRLSWSRRRRRWCGVSVTHFVTRNNSQHTSSMAGVVQILEIRQTNIDRTSGDMEGSENEDDTVQPETLRNSLISRKYWNSAFSEISSFVDNALPNDRKILHSDGRTGRMRRCLAAVSSWTSLSNWNYIDTTTGIHIRLLVLILTPFLTSVIYLQHCSDY